jgi:hypothetical protein
MSEKQFKTSDQRRAYQREYYKLRQQKLIEEEKQKKITGGNILEQKIIDSSDSEESIQSEKQYKLKSTINNVIPKIDKEKIVNFKLKHAISYIQKNINKDAEDYICDLADSLKYNIETTDGCYEFLKVLEKYLNKTF